MQKIISGLMIGCGMAVFASVKPSVQDTFQVLGPGKIELSGWWGEQFTTCYEGRMMKQSIPVWSRKTTVTVNGKTLDGVVAGRYLSIRRVWKKATPLSSMSPT